MRRHVNQSRSRAAIPIHVDAPVVQVDAEAFNSFIETL
jgi:hypothetical protein